jgi:hypothetical protein
MKEQNKDLDRGIPESRFGQPAYKSVQDTNSAFTMSVPESLTHLIKHDTRKIILYRDTAIGKIPVTGNLTTPGPSPVVHESSALSFLRTNRRTLAELVNLGVLERAEHIPGAFINTQQGLKEMDIDGLHITEESFLSIKDRIYSDWDISTKVFNNEIFPASGLFKELVRFDYRFYERYKKKPIKLEYPLGEDKFTYIYAKVQIDALLQDVSEDALSAAVGGAYITYAHRLYPPNGTGLGIDDVVKALGLKITARSRNRVYHYYKKELRLKKEGKPTFLNFKDYGSIAQLIENSELKKPNSYDAYLRLFNLYAGYYSKDDEIKDNNFLLKEKGSRKKNLPFYTGGVDLRTAPEDVEAFKKKTISPLEFARHLFGRSCFPYLDDKDENLGFVEFLKQESSRFFRMDDQYWELFEPMIIDGLPRYHEYDLANFRDWFKALEVYSNVKLSMRMKAAMKKYLESPPDAQGIGESEIEKRIGITATEAVDLGILTDVGFLHIFARQNRMGYEDIENFYNKYLKNAELPFLDKFVRDYRVDESDLEKRTSQHLREAPTDLVDAIVELQKQKETNSKIEMNFPTLPPPIKKGDKDLYLFQALENIRKSIFQTKENSKRVQWGKNLRNFYQNPESAGYVSVKSIAQKLSLNKDDADRLEASCNPQNPAFEKIQNETSIRLPKGNISPTQFDKTYFGKYPKAYLPIQKAQSIINEFKQAAGIELPFAVPANIDSVIGEAQAQKINNISPLNPYTLNSETKKGQFYFSPAIEAWAASLQPKQLRDLNIALAVREKIDEARKVEKDAHTMEEAASYLGISMDELNKFRQILLPKDIGLARNLRDIIAQAYKIPDLKPSEIRQLFAEDQRYYEIKYKRGTTNLNSFESQTLTNEQLQAQVAGTNWLSESVFNYCLQGAKTTQLMIKGQKRIHVSEIPEIKSQIKNAGKIINRQIRTRLGIAEIPDGYDDLELKDLSEQTDLDALALRIDNFKIGLYNAQEVATAAPILQKVTHLIAANLQYKRKTEYKPAKQGIDLASLLGFLLPQVIPNGTAFPGPTWHKGDITKIKQSAEKVATELSAPPATVAYFAAQGYFAFNPNGISDVELTKFTEAAYPKEDIGVISNSLSRNLSNILSFRRQGIEFFPTTELRLSALNHNVADISEQGMAMLLKDRNWIQYLKDEYSRTPKKNGEELIDIEQAVVKQMLYDLEIKQPENNPYDAEQLAEVAKYANILIHHDVHTLPRFFANEKGEINAEKCYYSRRDITQITKWSPGRLQKLQEKAQVTLLGEGKATLYSLRDLSAMVQASSNNLGVWEFATQHLQVTPLDIVMIYAILQDRLTPLNPRFNYHRTSITVNNERKKELAHDLKIEYSTCDRRLFPSMRALAIVYGEGARPERGLDLSHRFETGVKRLNRILNPPIDQQI